jgi:RNA polymerase sigma-70 factor (ECF subfamily)
MQDSDDDAELIAAMARGDDEAFARLYRRYLPVVLRWCLRETRDREVAADLAAEVFAGAVIAARRYRADGSAAGWLLGIARNKLRESQRRRQVENSARRRLKIDPLALTDSDLERVEELAGLDGEAIRLLADLPAEQRDAISARVLTERSYGEIAAELRCSESVVRQRVSRGLRTLRSQLEEK